MKKFLWYFLAAAVSFAVGLSAGFLVNRDNEMILARQEKTADEEPFVSEPKSILANSEEVKAEDEEENAKFLLSLSDNNISVYKVLQSGQTEFLYKKTVDASALRDEDYRSLCGGIMVYSEQEALEVLEDYIS